MKFLSPSLVWWGFFIYICQKLEIMKKIIEVYCGTDVEDRVGKNLHPLAQVKKAISAIDKGEADVYYSNSPEFVQTVFYYSQESGVKVQFYLNGKLQDGIEDIFKDFNEAYNLMSEVCNFTDAVREIHE